MMPLLLPTLQGEISYEEARERETNTLLHLTYPKARHEFYTFLHTRQSLIRKRVAHHLGLPSPSICQVAATEDWMQGSFNLCVPVTIDSSRRRVLIRFPLPYRHGNDVCPGNGDEKLRCEAATYAWMQQECPSVPIPHLYGFGLSTGQCFTAVRHRSIFIRLTQYLRRRFLSWLGRPIPSTLIPHQASLSNELGGYLLLEYIDDNRGRVLSHTWEANRTNERLRGNLFGSLSKIMLRMAKIHLPRIGSFRIDDQGQINLDNRPLTLEILDLENEKIPPGIPRDRTYGAVDAYIDDLLTYHDNRLRFQPNAINDAGDCADQMCALVLLRMLRSQFFDAKLNHGPFAPCLTDLSINNILVDKDWNITCLIDLEWTAVLPLEFLQTPYWLTSQGVDLIDVEQYNKLREEFLRICEKQEKGATQNTFRHTSMLTTTWESGTFWYVLALQSPTGLHPLFYERLLPRFDSVQGEGHEFWMTHSSWKHCDFWKSSGFWDTCKFYVDVYPHWTRDTKGFIRKKLEDKRMYDEALLKAFDDKI